MRVLVVDDAEPNRALLRMILEQTGARVETVADGAAAVAAVETGRHDLVLMDLHMPHVDGFEAVRRIRALSGASARLPIIALTADALSDRQGECRAAGFDDLVTKPISVQALFAAIEAAMIGRPAAGGKGGCSFLAPVRPHRLLRNF